MMQWSLGGASGSRWGVWQGTLRRAAAAAKGGLGLWHLAGLTAVPQAGLAAAPHVACHRAARRPVLTRLAAAGDAACLPAFRATRVAACRWTRPACWWRPGPWATRASTSTSWRWEGEGEEARGGVRRPGVGGREEGKGEGGQWDTWPQLSPGVASGRTLAGGASGPQAAGGSPAPAFPKRRLLLLSTYSQCVRLPRHLNPRHLTIFISPPSFQKTNAEQDGGHGARAA